MQFEWDEGKAKSNERKHGVDFELAKRVFLDPNRQEFDNGTHDGEERWSVLGSVGEYLIVVVIFTIRGIDEDIARIISARRANKNEQKTYYQF
jgi:uncharacterized DUF497 family protein